MKESRALVGVVCWVFGNGAIALRSTDAVCSPVAYTNRLAWRVAIFRQICTLCVLHGKELWGYCSALQKLISLRAIERGSELAHVCRFSHIGFSLCCVRTLKLALLCVFAFRSLNAINPSQTAKKTCAICLSASWPEPALQDHARTDSRRMRIHSSWPAEQAQLYRPARSEFTFMHIYAGLLNRYILPI